VKTKPGYVAYKGIGHGQWPKKSYSSKWRCRVWYCASACGWYYRCGAKGYYLPVRYITVAAPTTTEQAVEAGSEEAGQLPPWHGEVAEAEGARTCRTRRTEKGVANRPGRVSPAGASPLVAETRSELQCRRSAAGGTARVR